MDYGAASPTRRHAVPVSTLPRSARRNAIAAQRGDAEPRGILTPHVGRGARAVLVEGKSSRQRIGIVTVASPDFVNGFAFLSIARSPDVTAPAVFLDGVGAVLQFVFECWPFRRLYAEVTSGNLAQFERAVGDLFEVEGVRRNQYFMHGEFQDVALLTMTRERWLAYGMSTRRRLLKHAKPSCS